MRQYMYSSHVLYLGFSQVIWTHGIAVRKIRYIGFKQVIRAHITCLCFIFHKTQTGYMSPYYLSKAYITNSVKAIDFIMKWCFLFYILLTSNICCRFLKIQQYLYQMLRF